MALRQPENMKELIYFTNRDIGTGFARAWVFKQPCPECGKGIMGKPVKADGGVKIRSQEYECPKCGHSEQKAEYEPTLSACVEYQCPHCSKEGEAEVPFRRKKVDGVDALQVLCGSCKGKINITKKMKKGAADEQDDP